MVIKLEIDDAALDAAQAKADKLIATLKEAEDRMAKVAAQEKPPEGGNPLNDEAERQLARAERQLAQAFVQRMFKPESVITYVP